MVYGVAKIITNEVIEESLNLIDSKTIFKKEKIKYEIQDDYNFLMFSISVDEFSQVDLKLNFKYVAQVLNSVIPKRKGEYSWMVNFTNGGFLVDSYFGGDLDCPNAGL